MKRLYLVLTCLIFSVSLKAQTIDFEFIKSIVSQPDSSAIALLKKAGYVQNKDGDYKLVADNKIKGFIGHSAIRENSFYWAFQLRGKKDYSPVFKEIKKSAQVKTGTHFEKKRTEYKSPEGIYYYPFEDSMFDGLYWIYASKESLLDKIPSDE